MSNLNIPYLVRSIQYCLCCRRALELLNRAIALEPNDDMVFTTRSMCHNKLNNFQVGFRNYISVK